MFFFPTDRTFEDRWRDQYCLRFRGGEREGGGDQCSNFTVDWYIDPDLILGNLCFLNVTCIRAFVVGSVGYIHSK